MSVRQGWDLYRSLSMELSRKLKSGELDTKRLRESFEAFELTLRAYNLPTNWPDGPTEPPREHLPIEAASIVADMISYIRAGKLPEPIADMISVGAPAIGPSEFRDIGIALAYRKAVAEQLILDPAPVNTLAKAYGVTRRTISRWVQKHETDIDDFFPDAENRQSRAALVAAEMPNAARRYRSAGRGADGRAGTWDKPR